MSGFTLSISFPSGTALIGGYSSVPTGLHAVSARDHRGRPVVPATAIRGALRESLEALLRGAGERACCGGDGRSPGEIAIDSGSGAAAQNPACMLNAAQDGPCKACQLFGTQRAKLGEKETAFSGLILGDAQLDEGENPSWGVRPGVGVARRRRAAEDQRLFMQGVPLVGDTPFVAKGRVLQAELRSLLEAAVRSTKYIGAGRSRGLARVALQLNWTELTTSDVPSFPANGDVFVRVTLRAPAVLGIPVVSGNIRATRDVIPGSALRGAIGFALAEELSDPEDAAFQALVAEDQTHFGYLYPASKETTPILGPLPITAAACKREKERHGIVDTLLDRLALRYIQSPDEGAKLWQLRMQSCKCGAQLRSFAGQRGNPAAVATRTVTRVAMDRARSAARDEMLFSQEMIEAGTVFDGLIRNIPEVGRERLKQALTLPLSLGRGRSAGYGQVDVTVGAPPLRDAISKRAESFENAVSTHLSQAGLRVPKEAISQLVPITLLSPLFDGTASDSQQGPADGAELLVSALNATACFLSVRRFTREGSWDQRTGQMHAFWATAAGGVFVINLGRDWRGAVDLLEQLESQGIGERRHQGYGQLLCFDPFILSRSSRGN